MSDTFIFYATGKTYQHRSIFGANGWTWDTMLKRWECRRDEITEKSSDVETIRNLLGVDVEEINETTGVSRTLRATGSASSVQSRFDAEVSQDREDW